VKYLVLCVFLTSAQAKLSFIEPSNANLSSGFTSVFHKFIGNPSKDFTGQVVISDPFNACNEIKSNIKGNIVLATEGKCGTIDKAKNVQKAGGAALLISSSAANNLQAGFNEHSTEVTIPVYDVLLFDQADNIQNILNLPNSSVVVSVSPDANPLASNGAWIPYTLITELGGIACILLAIYKLRGFIIALGVHFSIPQVTLVLEILANIERLVYNIDPAPIDRGLYTFPATTVLITFSYPYSLISTLLIAFYWQETIDSCTKGTSGKVVLFLQRMRIPFIGFSVVFILFEHIVAALRAVYITTNLDPLGIFIFAIYICMGFGVGGFFIINGIRMNRILKRTLMRSTQEDNKNKALQRMTVFVGVSGAALLLCTFCILGLAVEITSAPGWVYMLCQLGVFGGITLESFMQILVFVPPRVVKYSSELAMSRTVLASSKTNLTPTPDAEQSED